MSLMPRITFQPFKSPDDSWSILISIVVAVHCLLIGWAIFLDSPTQVKQKKMPTRLVVQTVELTPVQSGNIAMSEKKTIPEPMEDDDLPEEEESNPEPAVELEDNATLSPKEVAFASNPLSPNPIKKQPLPPTPLERKTMPKREEQIKAPPKQAVRPAPQPVKPASTVPPTPVTQQKAVKPAEKPVVKPKIAPKPQDSIKPKHTPAKAASITAPKKPPVDKKVEKAAADNAAQLKKKNEAEQAAKQKKKQEAEAASKKKAAETLAEQERQQKLLADAQERIAKISKSGDKVTPNKGASSLGALPNAVTNLQVDTLPSTKAGVSLSRREVSYRDELVGRLKLSLRLPEYGDVKVDLTLNRAGKVVKVSIVSAESGANRKYIEKTLPGLSFPAFGTNFESATEYTFSITLSNEL